MPRPDPIRSRAVLLGTSLYRDSSLPDCEPVERNLSDLRAVLTDSRHGIFAARHCTTLLNETNLTRLGRHLKAAADKAEDLLLVYYAGHGCLHPRRHLLHLALPNTDPDDLGFSAISIEVLKDSIRRSNAANKVLILDCCFSGRAVTDSLATRDSVVRVQLEVNGTFVLTSAPGSGVALVLPGEEHTAFTGRLVELLREGVPRGPAELELGFVYEHLRRTMAAEGLPLPERLGTGSVERLVLTANRALLRPQFVDLSVSNPIGPPPELARIAAHLRGDPPLLPQRIPAAPDVPAIPDLDDPWR